MEDGGRNETLCKVCGDKASGKHYGVPSCDGCRGFFKRSIRRYARNLDYVCKENGRCIVDVSRRNQCQACRFTKCLQVNMKRDAVQHERAPRSTSSLVAAARRTPSALYQGVPHVYHPGSAPYHPLLYPAFFSFKPAVPTFSPSVATHFLPRTSTEHLAPAAKEDEVTSSEEAGKVEDRMDLKKRELTRLVPPILGSTIPENAIPSLSMLPTENVYELAAKLLFLAVKWPRSISSFLQLSYRDQAILIEESWSELFVLTAAQWNFPVEESALIPVDFPADRKQILIDETRRLKELLARCAMLRIDHSEFACLKAIVLFKGESRGLCEAARVTALQEQTVAVLCDRGAGRVGQLLLLLPPARALYRSTLHELLFKPTVGDVSVERLLEDMVRTSRPN
ncbi:nuclear receptor subfamily 2 group E member 1-like [Belonocnema kinseyi]|uniref:nuclear receptor subfamily 2 group E member 1-like n=1 Tax=Belonocnema kinseyi TaxID=2817044 RepID=UPI00143D1A8D|nr:nuclear receptor subfamily 2 group E member 1-like [Belonocnema kinseyi]